MILVRKYTFVTQRKMSRQGTKEKRSFAAPRSQHADVAELVTSPTKQSKQDLTQTLEFYLLRVKGITVTKVAPMK